MVRSDCGAGRPASILTWPGTTTGTAGSTSRDWVASPAPASTPRPARSWSGPEPTWSGTGLQYPESPHLYERDGIWYLLIAEGGTHGGHCVSVARGPTPVGPWEGCPANPILTPPQHRLHRFRTRGTRDLVEFTDGSWWMVLLGVRPRGIGPGFHTLGRETFLVPVQWEDGWPVPGDPSLEMATAPASGEPSSDVRTRDFDAPTSGTHWVGVRRAPSDVSSLAARPGWLVLHGGEATLDAPEPAFVGRRQQHHHCRVADPRRCVAATEAGTERPSSTTTAHYDVAVKGDRVVARGRVGAIRRRGGQRTPSAGSVVLTVETGPDIHGPDAVSLGFDGRTRRRPHPGPTRWPLSLLGGHGRISRPPDRDVRGRRGRRLRVVRLRRGMTPRHNPAAPSWLTSPRGPACPS